jgi:hypothetical protein
MFVGPVALSIAAADNNQLRVRVSYRVESNEWDIASQQIYNHRCTLENASLAGGPAARPVLVRLPVEPTLLTGRPEPWPVNLDVLIERSALGSDPNSAINLGRVRAWVYVIQPVASDPVEVPGLPRAPGPFSTGGSRR